MKKALSFAVALGLVAGVASVASAADLTINGDARWRGVYHTNYTDATDVIQDKVQEMDQRYRFNADLKINDDVKVNTRLVLADQIFGNNSDVTTGATGIGQGATNFYVDRANMVINTLGGTWTLGRQDASWGNKFLAWGVSTDRIKAAYKVGETMTLGGYLQQNVEGQYDNGDGDNTTWAAFAVGKVADTSWGVLLNYNVLQTNTAKASGDDTGYLIDPYFTTKVGPATILGELVYKGGDAGENSAGDGMYGGFVAAAVDLAPVTVKGIMAYYKNNEGASVGGGARDCDNDFAPSLLIGTCNETAMIDFGSTTNQQGDIAHADDSTYLIAAAVDFKASDKITVGGAVGYLMASEYMGAAGDENGTLVEVDLTASYALAQNATYKLGVAYGMPDKFSAADDDILAIGNSVEVAW